MTTQYTNSVSYLRHNQWLEADQLGYVNTVLYGASFMGMIPIVPTSHFMRDEYMTRTQGSTKLTQKRKLNEQPDAKSQNPFAKQIEQTSIYYRETDIDKRLADHQPSAYDQMLLADAQDMVMDIDYDIINGVPDNTGYGLNGLANRIAIASNSSTGVNNSATLTIDTSATTFKTFLKLFRKAVDKIKLAPGMQVVAFCNEGVEQAVSSGRDMLGADVAGVRYTDILNSRVLSVDNVPLIKVRTDSIGQEILPFSENSESSTSIWICGIGGAPSEGSTMPSGLCILSGDGVIKRATDTTGLTQIQTAQEFEIGLRVPTRSVVRLSRLLVA